MTAATLIKRIGTQQKEITRYRKEIAYYEKEYCGNNAPEHMKTEGEKWIAYYRKHIARVEAKIAEMKKQAAEIATEEEKTEMVKTMAAELENGIKRTGTTAKGLRYSIEWNNGMTERSRHCWTMYIEGSGAVFTSGTLETVARYILNN